MKREKNIIFYDAFGLDLILHMITFPMISFNEFKPITFVPEVTIHIIYKNACICSNKYKKTNKLTNIYLNPADTIKKIMQGTLYNYDTFGSDIFIKAKKSKVLNKYMDRCETISEYIEDPVVKIMQYSSKLPSYTELIEQHIANSENTSFYYSIGNLTNIPIVNVNPFKYAGSYSEKSDKMYKKLLNLNSKIEILETMKVL